MCEGVKSVCVCGVCEECVRVCEAVCVWGGVCEPVCVCEGRWSVSE